MLRQLVFFPANGGTRSSCIYLFGWIYGDLSSFVVQNIDAEVEKLLLISGSTLKWILRSKLLMVVENKSTSSSWNLTNRSFIESSQTDELTVEVGKAMHPMFHTKVTHKIARMRTLCSPCIQ